MTTHVGFIGLGNMGLPMARNLLTAGYPLHVFNRTAARAQSLLAQGAIWASSPRAVAEHSEVVITMLAALARGRGDLDWGALVTVVRELAGLEPRLAE